jgi:hypothetical protein
LSETFSRKPIKRTAANPHGYWVCFVSVQIDISNNKGQCLNFNLSCFNKTLEHTAASLHIILTLLLLIYIIYIEIDSWTKMFEITQPCGFAAVRTARIGLKVLDTFFDNILVVIQGVSRLEALQGALLPDADLVP